MMKKMETTTQTTNLLLDVEDIQPIYDLSTLQSTKTTFKMLANQLTDDQLLYLRDKDTKSTRIYNMQGHILYLIFIRSREHSQMLMSDIIDRLHRNQRKDLEEQEWLAERELNQFARWLLSLKVTRQRDGVTRSKYSLSTARGHRSGLAVYFSHRKIAVDHKRLTSLSNVRKLPPVDPNLKHSWTLEQLKLFIDYAPYMRTKAVITCLLQSGMDIGDLLSFDYGIVQQALDEDRCPIRLELRRGKNQQPYVTFFGAEAIYYLGLYLSTRQNLKPTSPLFTKFGSNTARLTLGAYLHQFRELAKKMPFISQYELEGWNPCRGKSLRSAFRSLLSRSIERDLLESMMGHELGGVQATYLQYTPEKHTEIYIKAESAVAPHGITTVSRKARMTLTGKHQEIIDALQSQLEHKDQIISSLQQMIEQQADQFEDIKERLVSLEEDKHDER